MSADWVLNLSLNCNNQVDDNRRVMEFTRGSVSFTTALHLPSKIRNLHYFLRKLGINPVPSTISVDYIEPRGIPLVAAGQLTSPS